MIEYNTGVPIPEIGDRITYRDRICSAIDALVTNTDDCGGYTDIYLNNARKSLFNINHTTGLPNTCSSRSGRWEFASKAPEVREWQVPAEPTDCKRVIATDGTDEVYTYEPDHLDLWVQASSGRRLSWSDILDAHDGVREHVQTDYEAAVEWFREIPGRVLTLTAHTNSKHARAIVEHVIEGK